MKWFMAANEDSLKNQQFIRLLRLALFTAKKNTKLDPFLIYEGKPCDEVSILSSEGIKILSTTLSISDELEAWMSDNYPGRQHLTTRRGAFLRTEMPRVLKEHEITDEFVLYTDCDVMFMKAPDIAHVHPKCIAACGRKEGSSRWLRRGGYWHFSSGVLVINTRSVTNSYVDFQQFVLGNGNGIERPSSPFFQKNLFLSDQVSLNLFYRNRIDNMPAKLNWNPSSGVSEKAEIVHFNGLKWTEWAQFEDKQLTEHRQSKFAKQIGKGINSYRYYCELALRLEAAALPMHPCP